MKSILVFLNSCLFIFSCNANLASKNISDQDNFSRRVDFTLASAVARRNDSVKYRPYDILAWTFINGCNQPDMSAYMADSINQANLDDLKTGASDNKIFLLPSLTRYLFKFGDCFSIKQNDQLGLALDKDKKVFLHGTINHSAMRASSYYLLIQKQMSRGLRVGGYPPAEGLAAFKQLLTGRFKGIYTQGHAEQFSPTYASSNLIAALNLYDYAEDEEIKKGAYAEAIFQLAALRAISFHGRLMPPLTRAHIPQRNIGHSEINVTPASSQNLLWLYFGEPQTGRRDIESTRGPFFLIVPILSNFKLPDAVLQMAHNVSRSYEVKTVTPRFSYWGISTKPEIIGGALFTNDFAIGAGNQFLEPGSFNEHNQLFGIYYKSDDEQALVDCYHPYWMSNRGEDAWLADRSSPFQQVHRTGSRGVLVFDIPEKDPFVYGSDNRFFMNRNLNADHLLQVAQCRFPISMDEVVRDHDAVYLREGKVFIALRSLKGVFESGPTLQGDAKAFVSIKIREAKTAIYFRVEEGKTVSDFTDFIVKVREDKTTFHDATAEYPTSDGKRVSVTFTHQKEADGWIKSFPVVRINGLLDTDPHPYVIEAPFLRIGNGKLEVLRGGKPVLSVTP